MSSDDAIPAKMNALVRSVLFIAICVCTCMPLSATDPGGTVWVGCENGEYKNGSAFNQNLNKVLESLLRNVYLSGFNTTSAVHEEQNKSSWVYGLVQCRGDFDSSDCKQCASTAKANLVQRCQNISGLIQLDGCFLRYDYYNFYSQVESKPTNLICNGGKATQPRQFTDAVDARLSNVTKKAAQSPKLFAADYSPFAPSNSTEYIYIIAQCWRDLSQKKCGSCLTSASSAIESCSTGAIGAQFGSKNCYLRYEIYNFFNLSVLPPLPPPSPPPPPVSEGKRHNVLGITLGAVAATIGLIAAIGLWKRKIFALPDWFCRTRGEEEEIILTAITTNLELIFNYDIVKEATLNFKAENKLGEGGFGSVFKGILPDGRDVAVKRLYMASRRGDVEFLNEVNLISRVQHRNLVKLLGCSVESSERLLIYEYLQNSSLDKILFDTNKRHLLDLKERYEIIVGTARGLAYLHEECEIRIIHRDIKASNILLDEKYRPKIADFGLAKLFGEDQTHVTTRVAGTVGYMAPEYALHGQLTEKADVFSFGVLLLEIISGRKNQSSDQDMGFLIERTWRLYKAERALEVMDPTLEGSYSWEEAIQVIKIGLLCTQAAAALRPSMSRVVWMLTDERERDLPSPTRPAFIDLDCLDVHGQLKRPPPRKPDKTSTSTGSSDPATSSDIHSAAVDPSSSGTMEPR